MAAEFSGSNRIVVASAVPSGVLVILFAENSARYSRSLPAKEVAR